MLHGRIDRYTFDDLGVFYTVQNDLCLEFLLLGSISQNFNGLYQYQNNEYNLAKTQFTSICEDVYKAIRYGVDGAKSGTLQEATNLTKEQILHRVKIYNELGNLKLNNSITSTYGMFADCINLISVPNIDTSNITDMSRMFIEFFYMDRHD